MRSLQQHTLPSVSDPPSPPPQVDSDIVVILAALLCALICVVGLALVARCAWFHRSPHSSSYSPPTKGIKKKVLDTLPKLSFHKDLNISADCPICLAEFVGGDEIRILPQCGHGFHVGCVDTWLGSRSSCPSCRRVLLAAKVGKVQKEEENRCRNSFGAEENERRRDGNQFLP